MQFGGFRTLGIRTPQTPANLKTQTFRPTALGRASSNAALGALSLHPFVPLCTPAGHLSSDTSPGAASHTHLELQLGGARDAPRSSRTPGPSRRSLAGRWSRRCPRGPTPRRGLDGTRLVCIEGGAGRAGPRRDPAPDVTICIVGGAPGERVLGGATPPARIGRDGAHLHRGRVVGGAQYSGAQGPGGSVGRSQ